MLDKLPWKTPEASKGLTVKFDKYYKHEDKVNIINHKSEMFEGVHLIIHDPFELPTHDSSHYHAMINTIATIWINVEALEVIESLHDYTPKE